MKCLVIMPFAAQFDPIFDIVQTSARDALAGTPIDCYWLKDKLGAGRITDDILSGIENSALCISDLTGNNANVMWETGFAMALGKPTILIGQSVETIPFDLKVHRVLPYHPDKLSVLAPNLAEAVRQTVARYTIAPRLSRSTDQVKRMAIAITGSNQADVARTTRRLQAILDPYLSQDVTWYCGSNGGTDDLAIEYLSSAGKKPIAVGYHALDLSAKVRARVDRQEIEFIDASVENLPAGLAGPTERDIYFAVKADLVILLWDGASRGTSALVSWFQANKKNVIVAFI